MTGRPRLAFAVAIACAALLIVSVVAGAYYYSEYKSSSQSSDRYSQELADITARYNELVSNYNVSASLLNQTISLLVAALEVVNTSLPIYATASAELSSLWSEYLALRPAKALLYGADVAFEFGNGTRVWFNGTEVQPGWNMYMATVILTGGNMKAVWYPQYQEHLVTSIDGVPNTGDRSWFLWTYGTNGSWEAADVGADFVPVVNGSAYAWTYCGYTASFAPDCAP
jgi:hypothetical protein